MAFDWSGYLAVARFLASGEGHPPEEAARRSAVSRAYYAAFGSALRYAANNLRFDPSYKAEDHAVLRRCLADYGMSEIAEALEDLLDWRHRCDYRDYVDDLARMADNAIESSQGVLAEIARRLS